MTQPHQKDFSAISISRQIDRIQAAFSISAREAALSTESDQKLRTVLSDASAAVTHLKTNGSLTKSRSSALYSRWVRLLNHKDQYRIHARFMQIFLQAFNENKKHPATLDLQLYPYSALLRYEHQAGVLKLRLQETVIRMPDGQIRELAQAIGSEDKTAVSRVLSAFMKNPRAQELLEYFNKDLPRQTAPTRTKGSFFNLDEVFERVNNTFFGGKLPKPALKWSAQANKRRMGAYNYRTDTVMINKALDRRKTPPQVIDFVMYHELLHKALGYKTSRSGRRQAHTAEFRKYEKSFPHYEEIEHYLNHLRV